jgi:hypothetical protein
MTDLTLLSGAQMRRIKPYFRCRMAYHGSMIAG